jgi:uncharacterized delta-60 repeat protein
MNVVEGLKSNIVRFVMRSKNIFRNIILVVYVAVIYLNVIFPATGDLDLSFGTSGIVRTDISGANDYPSALKIQTDGKIVVAGYTQVSGSNFNIFVSRYNLDGSPDTQFGTNGIVITDIMGHANDQAFDLVIQPNDGKILVVGTTNDITNNSAYTDVAILRYNANGTLDSTFGNTGIAGISMIAPDGRGLNGRFGFNFVGNSIALQSNGQIVVAGYAAYFSIFQDGLVFRLNSDGRLDNSFGTSLPNETRGLVAVDLRAADSLNKIIVLNNQKIAVAGSTYSGVNSASFDYLAVRFDSNGLIDNTFNNNGTLLVDFGGNISNDQAYDMIMQPDGKLLVTGFSDESNDYECSAARININGTLDSTFGGGDGLVNFNIGPSRDRCFGVVVQPNGRILLSGIVRNSPITFFEYAFIKLNSDGTLDRTFGRGSGISRIGYSNGFVGESLNPLVLQKDGKIVSVGKGGTSTLDIMLLRVQNQSGSPFIDFDGDSKTDISIYRPSLGQWWYSRSSDNGTRAFQFGTTTDKIVPADYTGDGKTDIATFTPTTGTWNILRSEDSTFYGFPFGTSGDIAAPADYDGDGKADPAVFRTSNSTWFINKSSGGTTIQQFGTTGDKPVVADYDGDGKADLAIYRVALGQWWRVNSSDGSNRAFTFGTATDKPIQGDYTGDGKADIAFFRPTSGEWFVLRSEDSSFYSFPFGASGDIPSSGDYDGDGKFDAAVFRPTNVTWFINRSTAGTQIVGFGANGDLPVPNAFVP